MEIVVRSPMESAMMGNFISNCLQNHNRMSPHQVTRGRRKKKSRDDGDPRLFGKEVSCSHSISLQSSI